MRGEAASAGLINLLEAALLICLVSSARGCGIDWSVPVTHFNGVDAKGHVCYSEQIEEVDFGDGLKLPLIINFRSDRESSSPYLGKGWILALLDSNFVQTGENAFRMTQPDGWVRPFYRGKPSDTVLDGGPEWKAEIKGDIITAWAGCGWRLTYLRGRLLSVGTPKDRKLELFYSDNKIVELREAGATKLSVEFNPESSKARALSFNGKRLEITQAERPQVQVIKRQNIIGGMDRSLRSLTVANQKSVHEFEFGVNDTLNPTLRILGKGEPERIFTWNPSNKLIVADGVWNYKIAPGEATWENAAINRVNGQGESDSWHLDLIKGVETIVKPNGIKTVITRFVSGKAIGKIRTEKAIFPDGKEIVTRRAVYDETGALVRMESKDLDSGVAAAPTVSAFTRETEKGSVQIVESGANVAGQSLKRTYDQNGKLLSAEYSGTRVDFLYDKNGTRYALPH